MKALPERVCDVRKYGIAFPVAIASDDVKLHTSGYGCCDTAAAKAVRAIWARVDANRSESCPNEMIGRVCS